MRKMTITAWAARSGPPPPSDFCFDLRDLPNPYRNPSIRGKTGFDQIVQDEIWSHDDSHDLFARAYEKITAHLMAFPQANPDVHVVFVCIGGKHRSVAFALRFSDYIKKSISKFEIEMRTPFVEK